MKRQLIPDEIKEKIKEKLDNFLADGKITSYSYDFFVNLLNGKGKIKKQKDGDVVLLANEGTVNFYQIFYNQKNKNVFFVSPSSEVSDAIWFAYYNLEKDDILEHTFAFSTLDTSIINVNVKNFIDSIFTTLKNDLRDSRLEENIRFANFFIALLSEKKIHLKKYQPRIIKN